MSTTEPHALDSSNVPPTFLTGPPAQPITTEFINFAESQLPEFTPCTALVLYDVLSKEECKELLALAEASVAPELRRKPWQPAMVAVGGGFEYLALGYRESDKITWDDQMVSTRIWNRCLQAKGLRELLATVSPQYGELGGHWRFLKPNMRMRFLKYKPGNFFKSHVDGPTYLTENGRPLQTFYTVQLYLNDSAETDPQAGFVGGATTFLSEDESRRLEVNPRAGCVLIFQHKDLIHEGSKVRKGVKLAMRTDLFYEWVPHGQDDSTGGS